MPSAVSQSKIHLVRLAHVNYTHVDLDKAHQFMLDFGLQEVDRRNDSIFYKGYGTAPFVYCASQGKEDAFGGAAFVVESRSDLELASRTLPQATEIHKLNAPGGGERVTFYDPVDNFPFHLVYGQQPVEASSGYPELPFNYPYNKHRPVSEFKRLKPGPAPVHKLGHFGCCVRDFAKTFEFYTTNFNLKPSDIIHDAEGKDITTFLHLDRGLEEVDHHTFFFFEGKNTAPSNARDVTNMLQVRSSTSTIQASRSTISMCRVWDTNGFEIRITLLNGV